MSRPRRLRLAFYGARLCNQLGQALFFAGLFWFVGGQQGAAIGASSLMAAMMAGSVAFGLVGGALSDRIGPGRAAVLGAAGRLLVILAALLVASQPGAIAAIAAGTVLAFLYSGVSQLYCPAEMALVRAVTPGRPSEGHAMLVVLQYAGSALAVAVTASLALVYRSPLPLLAGGVLAYVAVTVLAMVVSARIGALPRANRMRARFAFVSSVRLFRRQPATRYAGVLLAFTELAAKSLLVAAPYFLAHQLELGNLAMLGLGAATAIGIVGGLVWASRSFHQGIAEPVLRWTLLATVVSLFALLVIGGGLTPASHVLGLTGSDLAGFTVAAPVAVLLGACFAVGPVSGRAVLSAAAPRRQQSRVFAMQSTFTDIVAVGPLLLIGAGAEVAGGAPTFIFLVLAGGAAFIALEVAAAHRAPRRGEAAAPLNAIAPSSAA